METLQCDRCDRVFKNIAGFAVHKLHCALSRDDIQKIRSFYLSGLSLTEIVRMGFLEPQVKTHIKDIKRKFNASESLKKAYQSGRKKTSTGFKSKHVYCDKCKKFFHSGNFKKHICPTGEQSKEVYDLYLSGLSTYDIIKKGHNKNLVSVVLKGKCRSQSEAMKLAQKSKPDVFKASDLTRLKISNALKKAHSEGRAHCWNTSKKESYPESFFRKFLERHGFKKNIDYFQEYPVSRWRIDFFFPKKMLAIEIDGGQHQRWNRNLRDEIKDEFLKSQGYTVIRIRWKVLCNDYKSMLDIIEDILKKPNIDVDIDKLTLRQAFVLKILEEKKEQIKKAKTKRDLHKENRNKEFLEDAKNILGADNIEQVLTLKWKRTRHFVKKFFNKNFPDECITRATCECGKKLKNKNALNVHKKFCELLKNTKLKEDIIKDYNELFMSIEDISRKRNVSQGVVSSLIDKKRHFWETKNLKLKMGV